MNTPSVRKADVLVAFGANQGEREKALQNVVKLLESHDQILSIAVSSPVTTKAVLGDETHFAPDETNSAPDDSQHFADGKLSQHRQHRADANNAYLNAAIRVLTTLNAEKMHALLIGIEQKLGRQRLQRWGPRTIDLDLLIFGDQQIHSPRLTVPHPRMSFRQFVLRPALEIAADMVHPNSGMTIAQLVEHLAKSGPLICIATDDVPFVQSVIQNLPIETEIADEIATFISAAPQARLVVSCFDQPDEDNHGIESLERFATNFAGPMLQIDPAKGIEYARTELLAAAEAMTFETPSESDERKSTTSDKQSQ